LGQAADEAEEIDTGNHLGAFGVGRLIRQVHKEGNVYRLVIAACVFLRERVGASQLTVVRGENDYRIRERLYLGGR
jgi:hypothetical protein